MQRVQLYVEDINGNLKLVDLFDNESIQLTSTIQDIKDIGNIFTDYSQSFTIPASETNNKIFRHFYNYFITNGAYDSRKKKRAEIHINYMPFRRGKIFLNSANMSLNKATSYDITFYGETVSLKDLIGDDELTDLSNLNLYNHEYSNNNVKTGFTAGLDLNGQENSVIYPLITSKKRLFYDSSIPSFNSSGNLYRDGSSPDNTRGLRFTDLKPAIKAIHIIEAIENQYNINFTRTINTNTSTRNTFFSSDEFSNLYMWINSKKGEISDIDDDEKYIFSKKIDGYTLSTSTGGDPSRVTFDGSKIRLSPSVTNKITFGLTVSDQNVKYTIVFKNLTDGTEEFVSGVGDLEVDDIGIGGYSYFPSSTPLSGELGNFKNFEIEVRSEEQIQIISSKLVVQEPVLVSYAYTTQPNVQTLATIDLSERLPKMKVIDFLTGIFKVFNLTAFYIDDISDSNFNKIYVDTLDNFYSDAVYNKLKGTINIDKYLDVTKHTVNSILPFTDIEFKYEETNTVLMENHFQQFNEVYGDAEFNVRRNFPDQIDRGTKYEIKTPFSHMKYERILDGSPSGGITDIQWGYCAGGDFTADTDVSPPTGDYDSILIKPLLFYGILESGISTEINWLYNTSDSEGLTSYWKPSNSRTNDVLTSNTLNFDQEFDEWNRAYNLNSLYERFYKNYVEGVFNVAKRVFKVTAYLPPNILVNYRLNDQIKIQDKMFRINSITTELTTGKSELELLNIFSEDIIG